ncbi:MAG: diguanylate cyclase [Acidiferrobacterales bacterium]
MGNEAKTKTVKKVPGKGSGEDPYFIVISGGPVGLMYKLAVEGPMVIGRGLDADIRLEDDGVSRRHAQVTTTRDGDHILEDLGSSNGTFVNGSAIKHHTLKDGEKVQIGSVSVLKFSYQDDFERNFQQELFDRSIKDGLTGTYSKTYLLDRIDAEYAHARRHSTSLSLLLFDIDRFKKINDTHGHPAGDAILQEAARVVRKRLRTSDVFARYGGDEFVVLMRDVDLEGTLILAQRLRRAIKRHEFVFEDTRILVTISVGVGLLLNDMNQSVELIQLADKCLYRAKHAGRDCIGKPVSDTDGDSDWSTPTVEHD